MFARLPVSFFQTIMRDWLCLLTGFADWLAGWFGFTGWRGDPDEWAWRGDPDEEFPN